MDISFSDEKFGKQCNSHKLLLKNQGEARAKQIHRRVDALRAAVVLEDLRNTPGRLHELKGDRKGLFSFDLDGPYRLLFVADQSPAPTRPDGGADWTCITAVRILGVENTHE